MNKMYFYTVVVYDYDGHFELHYYHEKEYDNHEFNLIVQDCIDETVKDYSTKKEYVKNSPCTLDTADIIKDTVFNMLMVKKGFIPVHDTGVFSIREKRIFDEEFGSEVLRERYSNLTFGECDECFRDADEKCPVEDKHRT